MTRTTSAYSDKYISTTERGLFLYCANMPRMAHRKDANGLDLYGVLLEPAATNKLLQSNNLGTTWAKNGAPVTTNNSTDILDPEGFKASTKITGIGASGAADVYQDLANGTFTNDSTLATSFWIYPISSSGILGIDNSQASGNGSWTIDMSALPASKWTEIGLGSIGYADYVTEANAFTATAAGAAGLRFFKSSGTSADCYIFMTQQEENTWSTSPIETTTVAVARTADSGIRYAFPYEDKKQGSIVFDFMFPSITLASAVNIVDISDGGASADRIRISAAITTGYLTVASAATGGSAGATSVAHDICDNEIKRCMLSWKNGRLSAALMDLGTGAVVYGTDDTSVDIPDDIDRLDLLPSGGVIGNISLYPRFSHSFKRLANG